MTPLEARAEFRAIAKEVGPKAEIYARLNTSRWAKHDAVSFSASLYPTGVGNGGAQIEATGESLADLVLGIRAAWAVREAAYVIEQTRKMALAVIRITFDQGECSDAAIRAEGFTDADLTRYGEAACEQANAMSERRPFSIRTLGGSNGMPAEEAA